MKGKLVLALIIAAPCLALGQGKLVKSVPLKGAVTFAGVDRPGDLYVVMADGLIRKFDKDGKELATKKYNSPPTLFDPRDGTLSFAYFREGQKVEYLSPDMSESTEKALNAEFAISAWQVCPSKNEVWILDSADLSLKQTRERGTSINDDVIWTGDTPSAARNVVYMREYLNFLFILDKEKGLYMFNHLGRKIRHIQEKEIAWFSFLGQELYYPRGQALQCLDLYTAEKRVIPISKPFEYAMLTDERMILVVERAVEFYEFTPN